MNKATRILWFSRHQLTQEQRNDLQRIYGAFELIRMSGTINNISEILKTGQDNEVDVYAVVLPTNLLQELIEKTNLPVIRSCIVRAETGNTIINSSTGLAEKEYMIAHKHWEQVIRLELITKKL